MTRIYLALVDPNVGDPGDPDLHIDEYVRRVFHPCVETECALCGRMHDQLWTVQRVMVDTLGHYARFRLNGHVEAIDGSLPTTVERLPRDAEPVGPAESARLWHDENESHVFGGPNVAAALRHTIAADSDGWSGR